MKVSVLYIILIIWFCGFESLFGNNINYKVSEFKIDNNIHIESRFVFNDSYGLTWIISLRGVCIYDGCRVVEVDFSGIEEYLQGNPLIEIKEDINSNIWISSEKGLIFYDRIKDKYSFIAYDSFIKDNNRKYRIYFYLNNNKVYLSYDKVIRCFLYNENLNKLIEEKSDFVNVGYAVNSILINKNFWICTTSGLYQFKDKKLVLICPVGCSQLSFVDSNNGFLSTKNGLYKFNVIGDKFSYIKVLNENVKYTFIDKSGNVWIATYKGLFSNLRNSDKISLVPETYLGEIKTISQDYSGTIWLSVYSRNIMTINYIDDYVQHINFLSNDNQGAKVKSIFEDSFGNIWFGSQGGGVKLVPYFLKKKWKTDFSIMPLLQLNDKFENSAYQIVEDSISKYIYIGTGYPTWLQRITNYETGKIDNFKVEYFPEVGSTPVSLYFDTEYLWIGTYRGSVFRMDKYNNFINVSQDKISTTVNSITDDKNGNLFIASGNNIYIVKKEKKSGETVTIEKINFEFNKPKKDIITLYVDKENRLWLGTAGSGAFCVKLDGLSCSLEKKIDKFSGLHSDYVLSFIEDGNGFLWVATNSGLTCVDIDKMNVYCRYIDDNFQNCLLENSAFKLSNNDLIFGTTKGINVINPDSIVINDIIPRPLIVALDLFGTPVRTGESYDGNVILRNNIILSPSIKLNYNQNSIGLKFASTYSAANNRCTYRYKLEGFDKQWITTFNNEAVYNNLLPGKYIFKLQSSNQYGLWSNEYKTLSIDISYPIWQRWYAYVFYVIVLVSLVLLYRKYIIDKQKQKYELKLLANENEQIKRLSDMKQHFYSNVSHEIRTPLTLINSPLINILNNKELDKKLRNDLLLIKRSADSLMKLNNLFLDSLLHDTTYEPNNQVCDAVKSIFDIVERFNPLCEQKGILLGTDVEFDELYLRYDPDFFEQILFNLVSNAVKNTLTGGYVKIGFISKDDKFVIYVKDTGVGIPEDVAKNIFKRNVTYSRDGLNKSGVGIGLHLTKYLVELMGWNIDFETRVDFGTEFRIYIPVWCKLDSCYNNEENIENDIISISNFSSDKKYSILIVEDNVDLRSFMVDYFSEYYSALSASDGNEAVNILNDNEIDIVVSDILMPNMNGIDLCKHIKSKLEFSHIPIILLTAQSSDEVMLQSFKERADAYCQKPFNINILHAQVHTILENRDNIYQKFKKQIVVQPSDLAPNTKDEEFLCSIVKIIENNIDNSEFTVSVICDEVGLSQVKLNSKLNALTGMKSNAFIRNIKMKRAAQLLEQGELNVTEVMYSVGFEDAKYFRKCFKDTFGVTPSDFQKNSDELK